MAHTSQSLRRGAALLASTVAALGLLTACGNDSPGKAPESVSGTAAPATGDSAGSSASDSGSAPSGTGSSSSSSSQSTGSSTGDGTSTGGGTTTAGTASSSRCHTSELTASVGGNDPGAGQENFPIVFTNKSGRTCTVRGFPGAAFVNAAGTQLGPDPKRETSASTPATVTLKPGQSAWAGLTFSNPEISGAKTATPAALEVTPPDERDSLKVTWKGGTVPVSGNSSSVRLTVLSAGTGV